VDERTTPPSDVGTAATQDIKRPVGGFPLKTERAASYSAQSNIIEEYEASSSITEPNTPLPGDGFKPMTPSSPTTTDKSSDSDSTIKPLTKDSPNLSDSVSPIPFTPDPNLGNWTKAYYQYSKGVPKPGVSEQVAALNRNLKIIIIIIKVFKIHILVIN